MALYSFFDEMGTTAGNSASELILLPGWINSNWDKLLEQTETQVFSPGSMVIRAGSDERALYIVAFGSLRMLVNQRRRLSLNLKKTKNPALIKTIGNGAVINELTFLDGEPSMATVQALTECQLLYLHFDAFLLFSARYPELGRDLLQDLGRLLALQVRHMTSLLNYTE